MCICAGKSPYFVGWESGNTNAIMADLFSPIRGSQGNIDLVHFLSQAARIIGTAELINE